MRRLLLEADTSPPFAPMVTECQVLVHQKYASPPLRYHVSDASEISSTLEASYYVVLLIPRLLGDHSHRRRTVHEDIPFLGHAVLRALNLDVVFLERSVLEDKRSRNCHLLGQLLGWLKVNCLAILLIALRPGGGR